jgi:hypothetical protein
VAATLGALHKLEEGESGLDIVAVTVGCESVSRSVDTMKQASKPKKQRIDRSIPDPN